ncbi:putative ribonuclease H-like domain-containing protein [Tanacetum coccineum]
MRFSLSEEFSSKREVACKDYEINVLKSEFEKVKQAKEGIKFKIKKFDKALKNLDQLLGSQKTEKSKKGLGYSDVLPPHPLIYNRPKKLDLSSPYDSKENSDNSLVKEQVSKDTSSFVESSLNVDKETVFPVDKKLPDESQILLVAKATSDESMLWHRRLGHINFKNINTLVKDNLVRGLSTKCFENDQTCVACLKGNQHRASCKSKVLKENGIKREYSVARTPQQNDIAERRNSVAFTINHNLWLANSSLNNIEVENHTTYLQVVNHRTDLRSLYQEPFAPGLASPYVG